MKIILEYNNSTRSPVEKIFLKHLVEETIRESECDFLRNVSVRVSVALISSEKIREINKTYRGQDKVTDVLSFSEYKNKSELQEALGNEVFLGEILLCYDDIACYARSARAKTEEEFARALSHGVLHLLGLRHGKRMFFIQNQVSEKI